MLDVALVNNMPAKAFQSTERQFRAALGATKMRVRLHLFTLSGTEAGKVVPHDYQPLEALLQTGLGLAQGAHLGLERQRLRGGGIRGGARAQGAERDDG